VALAIPRAGEVLPPQLVKRADAERPRFYDAAALIDSGDVEGLRALVRAESALVQAVASLIPSTGMVTSRAPA
jgi:hypothetical protein